MFKKDQMTGLERIEAMYQMKPTDRVAVVHKGYSFCARYTGIPVADIYREPQKSYDCQEQTFRELGFDGSPFYTFVAYGAGEFGGKIEYKKNPNSFGPEVAERPIQDWEEFDIDELAMPDVKTAGCIPDMMEFAKLQDKHNAEIAFICGTPFTHTANLFGVSNFLECVLIDPEYAHKALRKMTDHILQVADYFISTFGKGRVLARAVSPTESNALISPAVLKEFSMPYMTELNQKVLEMGAKTMYIHMCGDHNLNLPQWSEVPFSRPNQRGMISVGIETSLEDAAKYFPRDIICGNLDPSLIMNGTPEEVYRKSCEIIEKGKFLLKDRFEFMSGCEVGPGSPVENVRMMVKAVNDVGWY